MPFYPNQEGPRFRESLTYEEKIGNQISKCLDSLNENDIEGMHSTIDALLVMTPIRLYDSQFVEELKGIDSEWDSEMKLREREYQRNLREAVCPDVIDKVSLQPLRIYWEKKLVSLVNLFDRRGIGLKLEKTDSL